VQKEPQSEDLSPSDAGSIGDFLISCRSFAEYQAMFALTEADLAGRVLDCPGGGASFTAAVCARGGDATAVDPAYATLPPTLIGRLDGELRRGSAWMTAHAHRYAWKFFRNPAEHDRIRTDSALLFSNDLQHHPDRYVTGALPELPFDDGAFDLVLSSHLLFTYADRLDTDFHLAALRELARVSRGPVRIYPLVDQAGHPLPDLLERLVQQLTAEGLAPRLVDVEYEFQRGAHTMLELHAMGDARRRLPGDG
jgi:hypothetical protein